MLSARIEQKKDSIVGMCRGQMSQFVTNVRKKTGCSKCRWSKRGCNGPRCSRPPPSPSNPSSSKKFIDDEASESDDSDNPDDSGNSDDSSSDQNEYDYNDGFLVSDSEESADTTSFEDSIELERKRTNQILDELNVCQKQQKTLLRKYKQMRKKAETWKKRAVGLLLKVDKLEKGTGP
tara:strand:+ start:4423 stop:4956 length:534 start_codon:yes stop_codon:yes gene_type:complete